MAPSVEPKRITDLAARSEVYEALDTYGLTEAEDIAEHLDLPIEQVRRVLLTLETELPLDDIEDEM